MEQTGHQPQQMIFYPQADQADNGPDENFRNPLMENKYHRDLLQDCFNHLEALAGQEDRI